MVGGCVQEPRIAKLGGQRSRERHYHRTACSLDRLVHQNLLSGFVNEFHLANNIHFGI